MEASHESSPTTLFVGLGSPHGDDRLGWLLAEAVADQCADRVIVKLAAHPHELMHWLDDADRLLVGDACEPAGSPGKIHRWSWPSPEIRRLRSCGTHDFGLTAVLELVGCLDDLPREVTIWSIEAGSFQPNAPLSAAVMSSVPELIRQIKSSLS